MAETKKKAAPKKAAKPAAKAPVPKKGGSAFGTKRG